LVAIILLVMAKRTNIITLCLIFILSGLGFGQLLSINVSPILLLAVIIITRYLKGFMFLASIFVFCFFLGHSRGHAYSSELEAYKPLYKQQVLLIGVVQDDGSYSKYKQMSFSISHIELANGKKLKGKVQISGFGTNAIYQGDKVKVSGKLYPGYSAYQGRLSYANIEVISRGDSLIPKLRRKFSAGITNALPEPASPFAMGILIGQRSTLPDNVKQDLLMVGLTHIIAVSGYNLTIILEASKKMLGSSKRLSTALSLGLIGIFLLITGSSASIVRASIVSLIGITASYHGRRIKPLIIILLSAVITAWANPVYIWSDIGWYLSFLAFFGVLIIAPLIKERLKLKIFETITGSVALEVYVPK